MTCAVTVSSMSVHNFFGDGSSKSDSFNCLFDVVVVVVVCNSNTADESFSSGDASKIVEVPVIATTSTGSDMVRKMVGVGFGTL